MGKQIIAKKISANYFHSIVGPNSKVLQADTPTDFLQIHRYISCIKLKHIMLRENRSYSLAEKFEFSLNSNDNSCGTLMMAGYLRGKHRISSNQLIHVTGYGDFQISKIGNEIEQVERGCKSKGDTDMDHT